MATREQTLISTFAAMEALHAYSAFLPSIMTIRKFAGDEEAVQAIRQGEALATAFTVVLGWVLSEVVESYLPFWFAMGAALAYLAVYEFALHGTAHGAIAGAAQEWSKAVIPGYAEVTNAG